MDLEKEVRCKGCFRRYAASTAVEQQTCPHCGLQPQEQNPVGSLPVGFVLKNRYVSGKVKKIDGEGVIYYGWDRLASMRIEIKEYFPATLSLRKTPSQEVTPKTGSEVLFKTNLYDFTELREQLLQFREDPRFLHIYDVVHDNGTVYSIREAPPVGKTLYQYLKERKGPMSLAEAVGLLEPVFQAVSAMHKKNLLHRGITPGNIYLTKEGNTRLGGFASQALRTQGTELRSELTKGFSAPEQYDVTKYQSAATDVYALASVLYMAATGQMYGHEGALAKPTAGGADKSMRLTEAQKAAFRRALDADIAKRTPTVEQFLNELKDKSQPKTVLPAGAKVPPFQLGALLKPPMLYWLIGGLVAVCALLVVAVMLLNQSGSKPAGSVSEGPYSTPKGLVYSLKMPNFRGLIYEEVTKDPQYSKFQFTKTEEFNTEIAQGRILDQSPAEGVLFDPTKPIELKVSKGAEMTTVPNVVGLSMGDVVTEMKKAKVLYQFVSKNSNEYPEDHALSTDPVAGSQVKADKDMVTVYLAKPIPVSSAPTVPSAISAINSQITSSVASTKEKVKSAVKSTLGG